MGSVAEVKDQPIIFFDGVCNLCNSAVNFIIDRDKRKQFYFASLQSEQAKSVLKEYGEEVKKLDTIIYKDSENRLYTKSSAALRIAKNLNAGWPLLYFFIILPKPLRDAIYDFIAARRYAWFGKRETCRLPDPELKERFLDSYDVS